MSVFVFFWAGEDFFLDFSLLFDKETAHIGDITSTLLLRPRNSFPLILLPINNSLIRHITHRKQKLIRIMLLKSTQLILIINPVNRIFIVLNVLIQFDKGQLLSHFAVIVSFADYAPLVDLVRVDKVGKTQKRFQLLLLNLYCKIALPLLPISIIELLAQSNLHLDIRVYLFLLTFE